MSTKRQMTQAMSSSSISEARIQCTVSGCGKLFNRKEHLNRHLKSHNPQRPYICPLCGRGYARSDVLKRHVQHHSQDANHRPQTSACVRCQERNLKCDNGLPCHTCIRTSTQCSRLGSDRRVTSEMNTRANRSSLLSNTDGLMSDQMMHDVYDSVEGMDPLLMGPDYEQLWTAPTQEAWPSLPTPAAIFDDTLQGLEDSDIGILDHSNQQESWRSDGKQPLNERSNHMLLSLREVGEQIEPAPAKSAHDEIGTGQELYSTPTSQSIISSDPSQAQQELSLQHYLAQATINFDELSDIYFREFHPHWPILHVHSFDATKVSQHLKGAMTLIALWLSSEQAHTRVALLLFKALNTTLLDLQFVAGGDDMKYLLELLQASLICAVYTSCCHLEDGMLRKAHQFNSVLITKCRQHHIFGGHFEGAVDGDDTKAVWIVREQLHRLAISVLRIDAYLSMLTDQPPSVRFQEINVSLPKSASLWEATSTEHRRNLQWAEPVGREKTRFCTLLRNSLELEPQRSLPPFLSEADYHLALCALQAGVWEAADQAHNCELDALASDPMPRDYIHPWRVHLDFWRISMQKEQSGCHFFAPDSISSTRDGNFKPMNLVFWHFSSIRLHAPIKFLQGEDCCSQCCSVDTETIQRARLRRRTWIASSCARTAIWNAAQITRIVLDESFGFNDEMIFKLNPVLISALVKSAIVICYYARYTSQCVDCTSDRLVQLIDISGTVDNEERLLRWIENGRGVAVCVPAGIRICKCGSEKIGSWFNELLAPHNTAKIEFACFLEKLYTNKT